MGIDQRLALYKQLEKIRGRPLIVYVTTLRQGKYARGAISRDVIPELLDQLRGLPPESEDVDLLLVSFGGDATTAWQVMSLLRERCKNVSVLLPQAAFSAATLLALGANEIVMLSSANLGPVDPQIHIQKKLPGAEEPIQLNFGYQDLTGFIEFTREEVGLTDQEHLKSLFQQFCGEVGTVPVGMAARSSLLSMSMGQQLLGMHMTKETDVQKIQAIVETLNKKYFHHGYPVSRKEAKEIGLNVKKPDADVENILWEIWLDIETDLRMREPFNEAGEVVANSAAAMVMTPLPTISIPSNLPPQVVGPLIAQLLQQIQVSSVPAVDFANVTGIMESTRLASRYVIKGRILAWRMPDGELKITTIPTRAGWQKFALPENGG